MLGDKWLPLKLLLIILAFLVVGYFDRPEYYHLGGYDGHVVFDGSNDGRLCRCSDNVHFADRGKAGR
jgi:hypothetical protein